MPLPALPAQIQSPATPGVWSQARLDLARTSLPRLMARHHVPGVALALVEGGQVRGCWGFGQNGPEDGSVTPATVFEGASLTKPLTALLAISAATRSGWSLETPLKVFIADQPWLAPNVGLRSLAEILSHRAGIRRTNQGVYESRNSGTWAYSTPGYRLIQQVLESKTGRPFEVLMTEEVLLPLGMSHTALHHQAVKGVLATGHNREGRPMATPRFTRPNGGSSLLTTAPDYAAFLAALLAIRQPFTAQTQARMGAQQVEVSTKLGLAWGLGWALERHPAGWTWFHWGSNPGFKSFAMVDPVRGMGLVVLTNGDCGLELIAELVPILDPSPHPCFLFPMLHPDD